MRACYQLLNTIVLEVSLFCAALAACVPFSQALCKFQYGRLPGIYTSQIFSIAFQGVKKIF